MWGREKFKIFSFIFLLGGIDIVFDNNCRVLIMLAVYIVPVSVGKSLYKGLRQAGFIIPKWDYKSETCLWTPHLKFHLGVSLLGIYCLLLNIFLIRDVEAAFIPTYLMGCWESNPIQHCFLQVNMVYLYAIQSTWWKCCI